MRLPLKYLARRVTPEEWQLLPMEERFDAVPGRRRLGV